MDFTCITQGEFEASIERRGTIEPQTAFQDIEVCLVYGSVVGPTGAEFDVIDKRTKNTGGEAEEVVVCCGFDSAEAYTSEKGKTQQENKHTWLYTGCQGIARSNERDNFVGVYNIEISDLNLKRAKASEARRVDTEVRKMGRDRTAIVSPKDDMA